MKITSIAALSALALPLLLPEEDTVVPTITKLPEHSKIVKPVQITGEIVTSDGRAVKPNPNRSYGHGYIIGSPISSGNEGIFFKTYELHINQGAFADNPSYIGSSVHLSIDERNKDIYNSFRAAEEQSRQQYVFEYANKHPLDPEIEGTHLFLKNVYPVSEFLQQLNVESLPRGIKAGEPWVGSSGSKTKVGRIVDIERYGQLGDFCKIEINMTGLSSTGNAEKMVTLTVREEDMAVWCEKAMALGRDVEIDVAEDFWEVWMPSPMVVNGIKFRDDDSEAAVTPLEKSSSGGITQEQYEEIRDRLMNDPVFNGRKSQ